MSILIKNGILPLSSNDPDILTVTYCSHGFDEIVNNTAENDAKLKFRKGKGCILPKEMQWIASVMRNQMKLWMIKFAKTLFDRSYAIRGKSNNQILCDKYRVFLYWEFVKFLAPLLV